MAAVEKSLGGLVAKGAIFTAGQLSALAARITYATVEGLAFAFGRRGAAAVVAAELLVLMHAVGPIRTVGTAIKTLAACVTGRALWVLFHTIKRDPTLSDLDSIWHWEPQGDDYQSGAWHVLRALVRTANQVREQNPALDKLLSQDTLQPGELAVRLYYLYALHEQTPLWDSFEQPGGSEHPAAAPIWQDGSVDQGTAAAGEGDVTAASEYEGVPQALMDQLGYYRPFACFLYDLADDQALSQKLAEHVYVADLASGSPAFFLSLNEERREVLLSVRGTYSPEDVFTDLLATGVKFEGGEYYCHSGMYKGAVGMAARFGALFTAAEAQGYQITLVGHSLGAGVTSMLTCMLKGKGLKKLKCYAFEPPACMSLGLSEWCADEVLCTVLGDDVVPRLSAVMFARLLEELSSFDYQDVAQQKGLPPALSVVQHLSELLARRQLAAPACSHQGVSSSSSAGSFADGTHGHGAEAEGHAGPGPAGASGMTPTAAVLHETAEAVMAGAVNAEEDNGGGGQGACKQLRRTSSAALTTAPYNPYVPGRVVFCFRRPAAGAAAAGRNGVAGGEEAAPGGVEDGGDDLTATGRVLLGPCHPALRHIRITGHMLTDHFIDTEFALRALPAPRAA